MPTTTQRLFPFSDASPAELREAILPEERDEFDASWRRALDATAETLSLKPLEDFLAHWRRNARVVNHNGHDHWRGVLDRAERIMAGERFSPMSGEEMRRRIAERLAADR